MVIFIDGDRSYMLNGLPWSKERYPRRLLPGKAYAEWHGCRATLVYAGSPEMPARYAVSGSDEAQCLVAARHFGLHWTRDMFEGQYGPVFPDFVGQGLVAKAKTLLELR